MFSEQDLIQLKERGIAPSTAEEQLNYFRTGFPFLILKGGAEVDNGILRIAPEEEADLLSAWDGWLKQDKTVMKFVPASGAATRMFKDLFEFVDGDAEQPQPPFIRSFFENIKSFAFFADLDTACFEQHGQGADTLIAAGHYKEVIRTLLGSGGMNYGGLPKGLLQFHLSDGVARTPVEEHLTEGALYAKGSDGRVNLHFTVSSEHRPLFKQLVDAKKPGYEAVNRATYHISFSEQKPSTDTIAADENNQPFRENGRLLFRPGGHGALIENLNDLDADVLFIKNIDNVVPDRLKAPTVKYKKIIAGVLVSMQAQIDKYLEQLDRGTYTAGDLVEMLRFLQRKLSCRHPEAKELDDSELALYLKKKFNRPLRVCGMVKNEGEPGGGPFWAMNPDGSFSLQILESSQIDTNNPEQKAILAHATHFNPVDLVCSVKNYKGEKFDLTRFVDKNCGFISYKSKNGQALKALELPGLWNGAMSNWNTVFVEVPIETFNPVKTVNDLLRPEHQG